MPRRRPSSRKPPTPFILYSSFSEPFSFLWKSDDVRTPNKDLNIRAFFSVRALPTQTSLFRVSGQRNSRNGSTCSVEWHSSPRSKDPHPLSKRARIPARPTSTVGRSTPTTFWTSPGYSNLRNMPMKGEKSSSSSNGTVILVLSVYGSIFSGTSILTISLKQCIPIQKYPGKPPVLVGKRTFYEICESLFQTTSKS